MHGVRLMSTMQLMKINYNFPQNDFFYSTLLLQFRRPLLQYH